MTRTEMLDYIRKNNLQDEVKKMFGKNFTNVKNTLLEDYINTVKVAKKTKANTKASKTAVKAADTNTDAKASTISASTAEVEAYNTLKKKYDSLIGAVAAMLCSIDYEETAKDLQKAIEDIRSSLS